MAMGDRRGAVKIAGRDIPNPDQDSFKQSVMTLVNSGRNADGQVIGQKIGRDQSKIELSWAWLTSDEWSEILKIFETSFFNTVSYTDMVTNQTITREMYVGDRSATPFCNNGSNQPTHYRDCKLNLIDTGR